MKFSVVLPVHNEEDMLKRTFNTILDLKPNEVVVILDRCNDKSELVIKALMQRSNANLKLIKVQAKSNWKIHLNFLYDLGIRSSSNDVILLTQADIALDPRIRDHIIKAEREILFFGYIPYLGWSSLITYAQFRLPYKYRSTGLIAFNRNLYYKYLSLDDTYVLFDTQIIMKTRAYGLPFRFIMTKSWNLRPYVRSKLYELGLTRCILGDNVMKILMISLARIQPEIFVGYVWCKLRKR